MEQEFENFVKEQEKQLFKMERFEAIGKGDDYIFQALAFAGEASGQLSLATTILSDLDHVPNDLKEELKSIQNQLHDFRDRLRDI
jgi:hypothetical protein